MRKLLDENPVLADILGSSRNPDEVHHRIRRWVRGLLKESPGALRFYRSKSVSRAQLDALDWREYAAIRILDYIDNAGREFPNPDHRDTVATSDPFRQLWLGVHRGTGGTTPPFFQDMIMLFRQLSGKLERRLPGRKTVEKWMERHVSGLDPRIVEVHRRNRDRIINLLIDALEEGRVSSHRFQFRDGMTRSDKIEKVREWWNDHRFHLSCAVRDPDLLNDMLDNTLSPDTMQVLYEARDKGMPFFVTPYYLSLLNTTEPSFAVGSDLAIRQYIIYSRQLVKEFGYIRAWEKEDEVEPGKPNAAGWLLPTRHNVHRRYPDVAILIPDTAGRACGGLCASCQRMYDFQTGHLGFDLERLRPSGSWPERLERCLEYFERDTQLRDVLITGGDALMSSDRSLVNILDAVRRMAIRKRKANEGRPNGEKYAELLRIRLGTRLPVYLPQRITPELVGILRDCREKALDAGIRQFVVQTHFVSALEITPAVREAVDRLQSAGWIVTNQQVFTASASRRGHTAKLRRALNDIGVLTYYTFSVKGFRENEESFATNARIVQELVEEKAVGVVPPEAIDIEQASEGSTGSMADTIARIRKKADVPFLATDRSVINLPGVGKSMSFRTIGITRYGRRIEAFDHDPTRAHSPMIKHMGKVVIVATTSISRYMDRVRAMGEDPSEYETIWGYSLGATEPRAAVYEYPDYDYRVTSRVSNIEIPKTTGPRSGRRNT